MNFFTADHHFFHELMVSMRGFKNAAIMNRTIIKKHNELVSPDDTVYFIGDFTLKGSSNKLQIKQLLKGMHGTKILILGNHDTMHPWIYEEIGFWHVHTYLKIGNYHLRHDPASSCLDRKNIVNKITVFYFCLFLFFLMYQTIAIVSFQIPSMKNLHVTGIISFLGIIYSLYKISH